MLHIFVVARILLRHWQRLHTDIALLFVVKAYIDGVTHRKDANSENYFHLLFIVLQLHSHDNEQASKRPATGECITDLCACDVIRSVCSNWKCRGAHQNRQIMQSVSRHTSVSSWFGLNIHMDTVRAGWKSAFSKNKCKKEMNQKQKERRKRQTQRHLWWKEKRKKPHGIRIVENAFGFLNLVWKLFIKCVCAAALKLFYAIATHRRHLVKLIRFCSFACRHYSQINMYTTNSRWKSRTQYGLVVSMCLWGFLQWDSPLVAENNLLVAMQF